ncbi:MAG: membrane protein insertase YidC [Alphaproteobacteria bacterium]|nr:MAG: membrane protein insertase YidC [Alphaproteobacteria bacterium]
MEENRNLILALVLSGAILLLWSFFVTGPKMKEEQARQAQEQALQQTSDEIPDVVGQPIAQTEAASEIPSEEAPTAPITSAPSPRLVVDSDKLSGSIALKGARIDDLTLKAYRETVDPESPNVSLLTPMEAAHPYFADFGWAPESGSGVKVPTKESLWQQRGSGALTTQSPVEIFWENGQGLTFRRFISIDENYMFTVRQTVENNGDKTVRLFPYGRISRYDEPDSRHFYILHEGFLGVIDGRLEEITYKDSRDDGPSDFEATGGWLGFTDKYWLTALIPDQAALSTFSFSDRQSGGRERFRSQFLYKQGYTVAPGGRTEVSNRFFAGAKENALLVKYRDELSIPMFDFAIDWGLFKIFTRPLFQVLDYLGKLIGNFGIAIIFTTVLLKLLFFPLANKQYKSMSQMKKVQPEMMRLRERYADDKVKQQQEIMELYKREQINPMAGCLPIVVQIPVFFAFYKVLFVTIEMRQAPFFGWVQDLSLADPTYLWNLFGLLPFDPSGWPLLGTTLALGAWPLIMGITMFIQMRMNPAPQDPIQEKVFMFMPIMFTVMLSQFSVGLVIYWAWNNTLSILQQYVMMRRNGVEVELTKNLGIDKLRARFAGAKASAEHGDKAE